MAYYDLISENDECTVVAEFENGFFAADSPFLSEKNLEDQFVAQLGTQEYEFLPVGTEAELIGNLRHQLAMPRRRVHDTSSMVSEIDRLVYQLQDLTEEVPSFLRSVGAQALRGGLA